MITKHSDLNTRVAREVSKPLSAGGWGAAAVQGHLVLALFLTLLCQDLPSLGLGHHTFSIAPCSQSDLD